MRIPVVLMRGGTSKCVCFYARDLPPARRDCEAVLLRAFGSPDPRQIDGVGGATSLTSKACLIAPPSRPDADVDYTFAQVGVTAPVVDWGGNCGNCSAAVGPFAVDEGLVAAPVQPALTTVRIHNTNTGKRIVAEVPTRDGRAVYEGEYEIAGVPGRGARIRLWFEDPGGAVTGRLLPTGRPVDTCAGLEVSIVDAANPVVFVRAADVGLTGAEPPAAIDGDARLLARLEAVRAEAAVLCGLAASSAQATAASPAIPKVALVGAPRDYVDSGGRPVRAEAIDLCGRILSMGRCHAAYALTGAICTAIAARLAGTVVAELYRGSGDRVVIGHPSGCMDLDVDAAGGQVRRVAASRTARRLLEGWLHVPEVSTVA